MSKNPFESPKPTASAENSESKKVGGRFWPKLIVLLVIAGLVGAAHYFFGDQLSFEQLAKLSLIHI